MLQFSQLEESQSAEIEEATKTAKKAQLVSKVDFSMDYICSAARSYITLNNNVLLRRSY